MKGERTVKMSKCYKVTLIVFGVLELVLGLASVAISITTIVFTNFAYWDCYYQWKYNYHYYHDDCYYYASYGKYGLYEFSNTAQGFWGGVFVIIAASFKMDFAVNPSRKIGSYSVAFSTLAFCISCTMVALECGAVLSPWHGYSGHYDYLIWILHVVLLSFASALVLFTFISLIFASVAHGCCCRKIRVGDSSIEMQIPMARSEQQVHGRYGMLPGNQNVHEKQALQRQAMLQQPELVTTNPMVFQNQQAAFAHPHAVQRESTIHYVALSSQHGGGQSSSNTEKLTAAQLVTDPTALQNQETFASPHIQRESTIHYGAPSLQDGGAETSGNAENLATEC